MSFVFLMILPRNRRLEKELSGSCQSFCVMKHRKCNIRQHIQSIVCFFHQFSCSYFFSLSLRPTYSGLRATLWKLLTKPRARRWEMSRILSVPEGYALKNEHNSNVCSCLQLGSYYGASVCAVDLNADGLSDLLVGAPMFSSVREEGRVYVYINQGEVRQC